MAHGGRWNVEQICYLVIIKICTNYTWREIAEVFRKKFPSTTVTWKDCESKFNKDLKNSIRRTWVTEYKKSGTLPQSQQGKNLVWYIPIYLKDVPIERREIEIEIEATEDGETSELDEKSEDSETSEADEM